MEHKSRPRPRNLGKVSRSFLERVVLENLGAKSGRVLIGPGVGHDNAVIAVGKGRRMILTADPLSIIPSMGMETSAWLSVHLIASDFATSGLSPQFASFTLNLPDDLEEGDAGSYLKAVSRECRELGVAIVAGHTGSYPGAGFTVVGGGTMFGLCRVGEYVDTSMARPGDAILMTKGAAIEATAALACSFLRFTEDRIGKELTSRAMELVKECSTVRDSLTAAKVGLGSAGVTSMHDATEGGVLGGLEEMAAASSKAFTVDTGRIHVPPECEAVCGVYSIDPLTSLSEGTLLITCDSERVEELRKKLGRNGIGAYHIGRVDVGSGLWVSRDGRPSRRIKPQSDGYWRAYMGGVERGID
jgi:hydrogenase maturation factor